MGHWKLRESGHWDDLRSVDPCTGANAQRGKVLSSCWLAVEELKLIHHNGYMNTYIYIYTHVDGYIFQYKSIYKFAANNRFSPL